MANFNIPYSTEREGQMEFFDNYGVPYNDDASILVDNTDGIYNGCIFEFKLNISNLNRTLFQAVKYLSGTPGITVQVDVEYKAKEAAQ